MSELYERIVEAVERDNLQTPADVKAWLQLNIPEVCKDPMPIWINAHIGSALRKTGRIRDGVRKTGRKREAKQEQKYRLKFPDVLEKYRAIAEKYTEIGPDIQFVMMDLAGVNPQSYGEMLSNSRTALATEGYEFKRLNSGNPTAWQIVKRPAPKPTQDELKAIEEAKRTMEEAKRTVEAISKMMEEFSKRYGG